MSYNFHRLPQSLRPRALKETGSDQLIYSANAPKLSRKARRCHCKDRRHVYLAKRLKIVKLVKNACEEVRPGVYKLCVRNHARCLRFALRSSLCVIDRSESLYSVFYLQEKRFSEGFQLIECHPADVTILGEGELILGYGFDDEYFMSIGCVKTDLRSCLVVGDLNEFLKRFDV